MNAAWVLCAFWVNMATPDGATIRLWPEQAPGPASTLAVFRPSIPRTKTAVIICPGGAYERMGGDAEGRAPALWLNSIGVSAFVLNYRVAPHRHPMALNDVQRAIRLVRARASEFRVDPRRIALWGFSAGGHLAANAAAQFDGPGKGEGGVTPIRQR